MIWSHSNNSTEEIIKNSANDTAKTAALKNALSKVNDAAAEALSNTIINTHKSTKIVRLLEDSSIKKTIKLDEISKKYTHDGSDPINSENEIDTNGAEFPIIRVNDTVIARMNIKHFTITSRDVLPTISTTFIFRDTSFANKNMPKDGDIISTYMRAAQNNGITYLRNDFLITHADVRIRGANGDSTISILGELFVPGFQSRKKAIAHAGTSKDVVKNMAKEFGLGFAYNDPDNTNDFQNWISCNATATSFLNELMMHAWKDETSFFATWVDLYYNICFVNVNKFLLSTENEEEVDIALATTTLSVTTSKDNTKTTENERYMPKMLSNIQRFRGTPFFIASWRPTNNSSEISMSIGYEINSKTYVHNPNIFENDSEMSFESLKNIPAYDQKKTDTYMLLRGRAKYDKNKNPESEMERVNHNYVDTYTTNKWCGIAYVMDDNVNDKSTTDGWSGNVHKNFYRAVCHNAINKNELDKMYITATCEGLCLQIMRGERIPVYIAFENTMDYSANNKSATDEVRPGSRLYTGYYIVDSIEYNYKPKGGSYSCYTTTFVLKRREWPTPEIV